MLVYYILYLVVIYFEIKYIYTAKREKDIIYFRKFNGLFFGLLLSTLMCCIYTSSEIYSFDTGDWIFLYPMLYSFGIVIIDLILMVISLFFRFVSKSRKEYKKNSTSKFVGFKLFLLVCVVSFLVIFLQYSLRVNEKNTIDEEVINETIIYLKDKYGDEDFEIIDIDRRFSENGWMATDHLDNYEVDVLHKESNIKFQVELDVDGNRNILRDSSYDNFINDYYDDEFKNGDFRIDGMVKMNAFSDYLNKYRNLNVKVTMSDYYGLYSERILPNDYGKIPSRREYYNLIIDYQLRHEMRIVIDKDEITGNDLEEELRNYLVDLAYYIIEYYDNLEDYKINYSYRSVDEYFGGSMYINKDNIILDVGSLEEIVKREY